MGRATVDWLDEVSVLGHAIWWAEKLERDVIVFTLNCVTDGYGIAFASQKAQMQTRGYEIKYTAVYVQH